LKTTAIIYLPPAPTNLVRWYLTPFAGLPFLLRNALTLQRSGIQQILIYAEAEGNKIAPLRHLLENDSRIHADIHWAINLAELKLALPQASGKICIANGSGVYDKKQFALLLQAAKEKTPGPLDGTELESFFRQLDEGQPDTHPPEPFIYIPSQTGTRIQNPEDFAVQHERLLKGSGQNHDSPVTRVLSRPVSRLLTRLFLPTPITPNQITVFSFFLGLAAAFCFIQGSHAMNILGGGLLVLSTWVDGADGEIARLKYQESELGGKLDIYCDNIVHFLVFAAIGIGAWLQIGDKVYLALGGLAAFGSLAAFLLLSPFLLVKRSFNRPVSGQIEANKAMAEKFANRDFIQLVFIMALAGALHLFIWVAAIGSAIFTLYLLYYRWAQR